MSFNNKLFKKIMVAISKRLILFVVVFLVQKSLLAKELSLSNHIPARELRSSGSRGGGGGGTSSSGGGSSGGGSSSKGKNSAGATYMIING